MRRLPTLVHERQRVEEARHALHDALRDVELVVAKQLSSVRHLVAQLCAEVADREERLRHQQLFKVLRVALQVCEKR
eukprot:scaffold27416_cov63-Phaeocystis_antarctica.AAC.4